MILRFTPVDWGSAMAIDAPGSGRGPAVINDAVERRGDRGGPGRHGDPGRCAAEGEMRVRCQPFQEKRIMTAVMPNPTKLPATPSDISQSSLMVAPWNLTPKFVPTA